MLTCFSSTALSTAFRCVLPSFFPILEFCRLTDRYFSPMATSPRNARRRILTMASAPFSLRLVWQLLSP
jgi:hypothetical protein